MCLPAAEEHMKCEQSESESMKGKCNGITSLDPSFKIGTKSREIARLAIVFLLVCVAILRKWFVCALCCFEAFQRYKGLHFGL